tara:strand:- start:150 stop:1283 length:1134 start_codon:yes stop_codon:yes gene_type:complete
MIRLLDKMLLRAGMMVCLTITVPAMANVASIGNVTQQVGNTIIERQAGEKLTSEKGSTIVSYDTVRTGQGKTAIEFVDETRVDVTQNSKLVIDEFVYDPNTSKGKLALKASFGTIRYASGQIAKNSRQDIKITTPTATIGVRGTDFTMTVDETGSSTIILLPSCSAVGTKRICVVGEISVESDAGQVILNKAFQATVVDVPETSPLDPIIIDINESLIDNLLIIRRPKEVEYEIERKRAVELADFLGFDFLEYDGLDVNQLDEDPEMWQTELDANYLDQNFLANVLDQLNQMLAKVLGGQLSKTKAKEIYGKDPVTGIELYNQNPNWVFRRDSGTGMQVELTLDQQNGYNINLQQSDFETRDYSLGDGSNDIDIIQK